MAGILQDIVDADCAAYERASEFEGFIIYAAKCVEEVLEIKLVPIPARPG